MFKKVAVVGDSDLVFAFRSLGVQVFSPKSLEEAKNVMETIQKENFAFCLLDESLFEPLREEREALRERLCPVVVGFSDYSKVTDQLGKMMREMAIKATGSDSLVKKRGEDGTR